MNDATHTGTVKFEKPGRYTIVVKGCLDESWSDRLAGMHIKSSDSTGKTPVTTLSGILRDQAQLSGVLNTLYELHLPILRVEHLQADNGRRQ